MFGLRRVGRVSGGWKFGGAIAKKKKYTLTNGLRNGLINPSSKHDKGNTCKMPGEKYKGRGKKQ